MSSLDYYNCRLGSEMHLYIKEVSRTLDRHTSIKSFVQKAVQHNVQVIYRRVAGAEDVRLLVKEFSNIDGIDIHLSERTLKTRIDEEQLDKMTKVELDSKWISTISDIQDATDLSKSEVTRMCVLRELHELRDIDGILKPPRDRRIGRAWTSIEANFESLFATPKSSLETRVLNQRQSTREMLVANPTQAADFYDHYYSYFSESTGHTKLFKEHGGQEVLDELELLLNEVVE